MKTWNSFIFTILCEITPGTQSSWFVFTACKELQLRLSLTKPVDHRNNAKPGTNGWLFGCHSYHSTRAQGDWSSPRKLPPAGVEQRKPHRLLPTSMALSTKVQSEFLRSCAMDITQQEPAHTSVHVPPQCAASSASLQGNNLVNPQPKGQGKENRRQVSSWVVGIRSMTFHPQVSCV